jgi:hypothetical protein
MIRWRGAAGLAFGLALAATAAAEPGFLAPRSRATLAAGDVAEVRWDSPCGASWRADEVELVLSLDGGATFPIRVTSEMPSCSSGFRWRVPSLASSHARLALRTGRQGQHETERIQIVSDEFVVVTLPAAAAEELIPGAAEWWTPQALTEVSAVDRLGESWTGRAEHVVPAVAETDLGEPTPQSLEDSRPSSSSRLLDGLESRGPAGRAAPKPRASAPIPLRE